MFPKALNPNVWHNDAMNEVNRAAHSEPASKQAKANFKAIFTGSAKAVTQFGNLCVVQPLGMASKLVVGTANVITVGSIKSVRETYQKLPGPIDFAHTALKVIFLALGTLLSAIATVGCLISSKVSELNARFQANGECYKKEPLALPDHSKTPPTKTQEEAKKLTEEATALKGKKDAAQKAYLEAKSAADLATKTKAKDAAQKVAVAEAQKAKFESLQKEHAIKDKAAKEAQAKDAAERTQKLDKEIEPLLNGLTAHTKAAIDAKDAAQKAFGNNQQKATADALEKTAQDIKVQAGLVHAAERKAKTAHEAIHKLLTGVTLERSTSTLVSKADSSYQTCLAKCKEVDGILKRAQDGAIAQRTSEKTEAAKQAQQAKDEAKRQLDVKLSQHRQTVDTETQNALVAKDEAAKELGKIGPMDAAASEGVVNNMIALVAKADAAKKAAATAYAAMDALIKGKTPDQYTPNTVTSAQAASANAAAHYQAANASLAQAQAQLATKKADEAEQQLILALTPDSQEAQRAFDLAKLAKAEVENQSNQIKLGMGSAACQLIIDAFAAPVKDMTDAAKDIQDAYQKMKGVIVGKTLLKTSQGLVDRANEQNTFVSQYKSTVDALTAKAQASLQKEAELEKADAATKTLNAKLKPHSDNATAENQKAVKATTEVNTLWSTNFKPDMKDVDCNALVRDIKRFIVTAEGAARAAKKAHADILNEAGAIKLEVSSQAFVDEAKNKADSAATQADAAKKVLAEAEAALELISLSDAIKTAIGHAETARQAAEAAQIKPDTHSTDCTAAVGIIQGHVDDVERAQKAAETDLAEINRKLGAKAEPSLLAIQKAAEGSKKLADVHLAAANKILSDAQATESTAVTATKDLNAKLQTHMQTVVDQHKKAEEAKTEAETAYSINPATVAEFQQIVMDVKPHADAAQKAYEAVQAAHKEISTLVVGKKGLDPSSIQFKTDAEHLEDEAKDSAKEALRILTKAKTDVTDFIESELHTPNQTIVDESGIVAKAKADAEKAITGIKAATVPDCEDIVREIQRHISSAEAAEKAFKGAHATMTALVNGVDKAAFTQNIADILKDAEDRAKPVEDNLTAIKAAMKNAEDELAAKRATVATRQLNARLDPSKKIVEDESKNAKDARDAAETALDNIKDDTTAAACEAIVTNMRDIDTAATAAEKKVKDAYDAMRALVKDKALEASTNAIMDAAQKLVQPAADHLTAVKAALKKAEDKLSAKKTAEADAAKKAQLATAALEAALNPHSQKVADQRALARAQPAAETALANIKDDTTAAACEAIVTDMRRIDTTATAAEQEIKDAYDAMLALVKDKTLEASTVTIMTAAQQLLQPAANHLAAVKAALKKAEDKLSAKKTAEADAAKKAQSAATAALEAALQPYSQKVADQASARAQTAAETALASIKDDTIAAVCEAIVTDMRSIDTTATTAEKEVKDAYDAMLALVKDKALAASTIAIMDAAQQLLQPAADHLAAVKVALKKAEDKLAAKKIDEADAAKKVQSAATTALETALDPHSQKVADQAALAQAQTAAETALANIKAETTAAACEATVQDIGRIVTAATTAEKEVKDAYDAMLALVKDKALEASTIAIMDAAQKLVQPAADHLAAVKGSQASAEAKLTAKKTAEAEAARKAQLVIAGLDAALNLHSKKVVDQKAALAQAQAAAETAFANIKADTTAGACELIVQDIGRIVNAATTAENEVKDAYAAMETLVAGKTLEPSTAAIWAAAQKLIQPAADHLTAVKRSLADAEAKLAAIKAAEAAKATSGTGAAPAAAVVEDPRLQAFRSEIQARADEIVASLSSSLGGLFSSASKTTQAQNLMTEAQDFRVQATTLTGKVKLPARLKDPSLTLAQVEGTLQTVAKIVGEAKEKAAEASAKLIKLNRLHEGAGAKHKQEILSKIEPTKTAAKEAADSVVGAYEIYLQIDEVRKKMKGEVTPPPSPTGSSAVNSPYSPPT